MAALERKPRQRRMLVIVNPYATTMSDRVKNLVVYALQGRYDVQAVDTQAKGHAIELCREAAHEGYDVVVAFGGDGTVNEAANGLVGSPTPLTCLPGGATNVYCRMLGIPADVVDATEHLLRARRQLARAPRRPRPARRPALHVSAGMGLDASVVERVDRNPRLKARFGPWYFAQSAVRTFLERYVVRPPQLEVDGRRQGPARRQRVRPERRRLHVLPDPPGPDRDGASSWTPAPVRRGAHAREPGRCPDRRVPRPVQARQVGRHRQVEPFTGVYEVASARSTAGRCRSTSTATTSPTRSR